MEDHHQLIKSHFPISFLKVDFRSPAFFISKKNFTFNPESLQEFNNPVNAAQTQLTALFDFLPKPAYIWIVLVFPDEYRQESLSSR